MIEDALTYDAPRRIEGDVVIIGSGISAMAVASRLVGHNKRVVIFECGGTAEDRDAQRESWDGVVTASNGEAADIHPPTHMGRVRALGGASTVWGGRCTPFDRNDIESRTDGSAPWPISYDDYARYIPATNTFLDAGAPDYTLEHSARGEAKRNYLAPPDDDRVIEGIERFSLPTNAGRDFKKEILDRPDVQVIVNATVVEVLSDKGGQKIRGVRARTARGTEIEAHAPISVIAAGGLETPRILLSSQVDGSDKSLGNHHDQVGRYYQGHIWGQCGQFLFDRHIARAVCFAEKTTDSVYFKRNLILTPEERMRQGVLAMCLRPSMGNFADPALRVPGYSLIYLMRKFLNPELRRHLEQYANEQALTSRELALGHFTNVVKGLPQLATFLARYTRGRLLSQRREPGILQYHHNGIYGVEFSAEQAPNFDSRVHVDLSKRDKLGLPGLCVDWRLMDIDRHTIGASLKTFRDCLEHRPDASIRLSDDEIEQTVWALRPAKGHHMGTARMSASPASGVVDADAQVWGVNGLYVAGSAVLPTSGYSNPTMPGVSLALRLGDHLAKQLGINAHAA